MLYIKKTSIINNEKIMNLDIFNNKKLYDLLEKNDVAVLSLFGSSARDEEKESSDIDLLVKFKKTKSLLTFVRLERQLSKILGKKVDLVTENSISPRLKDMILKDTIRVYEKKD
jgi:hypothetical protein